MKNIAIVAHKFLTQPDDELVVFLNREKRYSIIHITHSFSDAGDRISRYRLFEGGRLMAEGKSWDFVGFPEPIIYLKECFFTVYWLFKSGRKWDYYVGMDGLCVLFGLLLRFFSRVGKVVFWAIDFVPQSRFASDLKNRVYHMVNKAGYRLADEMWDLSPRMAEAREKFLGFPRSGYRSHRIVPYGAWTDRVARYDYDHCEKNTLVFMGHLLPKQGVQHVIEVMPEILRSMPEFVFKIIGEGKYKDDLINLAKDKGVIDHCRFLGKIERIEDLENEIAKACLAIAPYVKELDTWSYYADPGKVKTYLACGVPVLLTDIPWNAHEIMDNGCGLIIGGGVIQPSVIIDNMASDKNKKMRSSSIKYSQRFDYNAIFRAIIT